jgi:hypothetical protein
VFLTFFFSAFHHSDRVRGRIDHLPNLFVKSTESGFWYIVNAPDLPVEIPERSNAKGPPTASPTTPAWFDRHRPWAGFYPKHGLNEGEVLNRITIPNAQLPTHIFESGGEWFLDVQVAFAWKELEEGFASAYRMLTSDNVLGHIPTFNVPRAPSTYKYDAKFPSRDAAFQTIRLARNAFVRCAACLSFVLSLWRLPQLPDPFEHLDNRSYKAAASTPWVRSLRHGSSIGDFAPGTRTGYFYDLFDDTNPWLRYLHLFAEAGIPIYIYAGREPKETLQLLQHTFPQFYSAVYPWMPSQLRLEAAVGKYLGGVLHAFAPPLEFWTSNGFKEAPLLPKKITSESYEDGMHPRVYFQILREKSETWKLSDFVRDDQIDFRTRASECTSWTPEYHKDMPMRLWEFEGSKWSRRAISDVSKRALFEAHAPSQRFYFALWNQLDLCWDLDPSAGIPDTNIANDHLGDDEETFPSPSTHESHGASPQDMDIISNSPIIPSMDFDLSYSDYGDDDDTDEGDLSPRSAYRREKMKASMPEKRPPASTNSQPQPLSALSSHSTRTTTGTNVIDGVLRSINERLGYDITDPLPSEHRSNLAQLASLKDFENTTTITTHNWVDKVDYLWLKVRAPINETLVQFLGFPRALGPHLSPTQYEGLKDIVLTLQLVFFGDARDRFPSRWDITRTWTFSNPQLSFCPIWYRALHGKSSKLCRRIILTTLEPLESQMFVLSASATSLLQAKRMVIDDKSGIMASARYFVKRGIPFNTAKAFPRSVQPHPGFLRKSHGILEAGERVSAERYKIYHEDCERMLSSSRGLIALKLGGVLWRLARHLDTRQNVEELLRRPLRQEANYLCGWTRDLFFYDDVLQPHEVDRIIGTYTILPQRFRSGQSQTIATLWPTPYAWSTSGLNTGEWNENAEVWFQARLDELQAGRGVPKTSGEWRKELAPLKGTRAVWDGYEIVAEDYLLQASRETS